MTGVDKLIEEVEAGPRGPEVGAFFDVDGTLIAGYSAQVFYQEFLRRMEVSPIDIGRSVIAAFEMALRDTDVTRLTEIAAESWKGKAEIDLIELGQQLFDKRIAGMVYPEARALVSVHQRMGHTVAIASSATLYQVGAIAADLEVKEVLSTMVEVVRGTLTGRLDGSPLWGPEKARAVRELAERRGLDLARSYGYANGDEDVPFLESVGLPRALNPQSQLERIARDRGWPIERLGQRGRPGVRDVARTGAALTGLGTAALLGAGVGLINRSRRDAANFATSIGSDAALALAGVHLNVTGEENLWSQRPAVFIFNHQSSIDVAVIGSLLRHDVTGVAKKEASRDPRFALIGYLADMAYVDRGNTRQAKAALEPAVERLRQGISIGIAPEGTRSSTPKLGRFKKGAFHLAMQAGVPIVPIVVRNAGDVMWRNSYVIRAGTVDVSVLEPIDVSDWKAEELSERVEEVRQRFADTLENWPDGKPAKRPTPPKPARPTSPSRPKSPARAPAR